MVYLKDSGYQVLDFNKETKLYKIRSRWDGKISLVPRSQLIADDGDKEIARALKNN
jgi:hypothetical protein